MAQKLNYHHLRLFWEVAKAGTITAACKNLNLAQPTVSAQLQVFEQTLGCSLFIRRGRSLKLTPTGENVLRRADEIFELGKDLVSSLKNPNAISNSGISRIYVGITSSFPKLLAYRLLSPAFVQNSATDPERTHLIIRTGSHASLLTMIAAGDLDMILTDSPVEPSSRIRAFNHELGQTTMSIMCSKSLYPKLSENFPYSLNGAPCLYHTVGTNMRRNFDLWVNAHGITPVCLAEMDDTSLIHAGAQWGERVFAVPSLETHVLMQRYSNIKLLDEIKDIQLHYYAITGDRRISNPAVAELLGHARKIFEIKPIKDI